MGNCGCAHNGNENEEKKCGGPDCACFKKHRAAMATEFLDLPAIKSFLEREADAPPKDVQEVVKIVVKALRNIYNPEGISYDGLYLRKMAEIVNPSLSKNQLNWLYVEGIIKGSFSHYVENYHSLGKTGRETFLANAKNSAKPDLPLSKVVMLGLVEAINLLEAANKGEKDA